MMYQDKLVSVIIPIYNAHKFLHRCIQSVLEQKYTNIEIILIDDGSTDDSLKICEEFKKIDHRVRVFSRNNSGVCATRNFGIEQATGSFIIFVDSDDSIDQGFIMTLVDSLIKNNSDIAMCDFVKNGKREHPNWGNKVFRGEEICIAFLKGEICNRIMNKLYKMSIVKNIRFPESRFLKEDAAWTPRVLKECTVATRVDYGGYNYNENEGSLSHRHINESDGCGAYRNSLDKLKVIYETSNIYSDQDVLRTFQTNYREILEEALFSGRNLNIYDVYELLRWFALELRKNNYATDIIIMISDSNNYSSAQLKYVMYLIIYEHKYIRALEAILHILYRKVWGK